MANVGTFATLAALKADVTHGDGHAADGDDADLTDDGTGQAGTADYHGGVWALHAAVPAPGPVVNVPQQPAPQPQQPAVGGAAFGSKADFVEGNAILAALNA